MRVDAFAASDQGLVRTNNEDTYLVGSTVFAVADGLGGHQAGEVAAAMALEPLRELDGQAFEPDAGAQALVAAVRDANRLVFDAAASQPAWNGMGTTLTAALRTGDVLQLAHVGDSRAYLLRADQPVRQLTHDQTAVAEAVRRGRLTSGQASIHPARSVLLQAVGLEPDVEVDSPDPVELAPSDQVLLCSDGLTEPLGDDVIAQVLVDTADGETACQRLIDAANAAGGPDNVTVVLLRASG